VGENNKKMEKESREDAKCKINCIINSTRLGRKKWQFEQINEKSQMTATGH
jgi:hypothetical protein